VHRQRNADCLLGSSQVSGCKRYGFGDLRLGRVPLGELPPPPPNACFGRDELIREVVGFAENLKSIALVGAGGIGKTSIALEVLHHDRIKDRFGDNRRFIRCDQFPASCSHLLSRLSQVTGAGIENPEDLTPLRPFLSSGEMILFLDNAESILDPAGPDAQKIYTVVEELTRFKNICLGITSRISTVPPHCKRPIIPTLSTESACDIFYAIYQNCGWSDIISHLVRQLDFHALSITLLATVASHNMWGYDQVAKEWETQRAQVLRTEHNESLAAAIELSLVSQTFHKLTPSPSPSPSKSPHGRAVSSTFHQLIPSSMLHETPPSARELLEVVAFLPQGVDENNLDWLFPTVSDRKNIFNKFCILSLTYRSNGFITMLAPIREYLTPKDPTSSPLLCATKGYYSHRLSIDLDPQVPGFGEAMWIVKEDVNVEHLIDVFTSINPDVDDNWDTCDHFMEHLYWHKPRQTVLRQKIEALSDDHPSKPQCLLTLSSLLNRIGNHAEEKRLLTHILQLERQQTNGRVAETLRYLSEANRLLRLYEEGIKQAEEAQEIYKQLGDEINKGYCLNDLARLLFDNGQLDAAGNAASRAIDLLPKKGEEFTICQLHRVLGKTYHSKGEREKAIHHFETAIGIATSFNWLDELFWSHFELADLFHDEGKFNDANAHIKRAKSYAINDAFNTGYAMEKQAQVWYRQGRLDDARSEALCALGVYEKLGVAEDARNCREFLRLVEQAMEARSTCAVSDSSGEHLETIMCSTPVDPPSLEGAVS
jgi:tetratricopeptide (TPR) repeat protein